MGIALLRLGGSRGKGGVMDNMRIEKYVDLDVSVIRAWEAVTDYRQFGEWFHAKMDSPFIPGASSHARIEVPGKGSATLELEVLKMEPERYFSFTWHPYALDPKKNYSKETPTLVEFRLTETSEGTLLVVSESGFDKLPAERRDEAFRMHAKGWEQQLESISKYLAAPKREAVRAR
jgi:uncharacterized protein YndB with AHSA1/START domain